MELVVISGQFTSHSISLRQHRHLRGHMTHKRYTVSIVAKERIHTSLRRKGDPNPGSRRDGTLAIHYH